MPKWRWLSWLWTEVMGTAIPRWTLMWCLKQVRHRFPASDLNWKWKWYITWYNHSLLKYIWCLMYSYVKLDFGPIGFHIWVGLHSTSETETKRTTKRAWLVWTKKNEITREGITISYCACLVHKFGWEKRLDQIFPQHTNIDLSFYILSFGFKHFSLNRLLCRLYVLESECPWKATAYTVILCSVNL